MYQNMMRFIFHFHFSHFLSINYFQIYFPFVIILSRFNGFMCLLKIFLWTNYIFENISFIVSLFNPNSGECMKQLSKDSSNEYLKAFWLLWFFFYCSFLEFSSCLKFSSILFFNSQIIPFPILYVPQNKTIVICPFRYPNYIFSS